MVGKKLRTAIRRIYTRPAGCRKSGARCYGKRNPYRKHRVNAEEEQGANRN